MEYNHVVPCLVSLRNVFKGHLGGLEIPSIRIYNKLFRISPFRPLLEVYNIRDLKGNNFKDARKRKYLHGRHRLER